MMFSASYAWAIAEGKEGSYYAVSQMKNAGLGLVLMLFLCMVDYHFFQKKLIAIGAYVLPLILLDQRIPDEPCPRSRGTPAGSPLAVSTFSLRKP